MLHKRFEVFDNVFTIEEVKNLHNELIAYDYYYGEYDLPHLPPTGLVHNFDPYDEMYLKLLNRTKKYLPEFDKCIPERSYINFFAPHEDPFFHNDGNVLTVLHYICDFRDLQENGETQFLNDDTGHLVSVLPKPGRMVIFDGTIWHRATSFRTVPRLTVAIKFSNIKK